MERIKFSEGLVDKARALGVIGYDAGESALRKMVRNAAPISHAKGRLRYGDWVFNATRGSMLVTNVSEIDCKVCDDTGRSFMYEVCDECDCEGRNIDSCAFRTSRSVPCPACSMQKQANFY